MSSISNSRFFETNCYFMDMSQYEKALAWIKAKAKTLPGGKADIMRLTGATKPTLYRALNDSSGTPPSAATFFDWLDALGFTLLTPDEKPEQERRPEVDENRLRAEISSEVNRIMAAHGFDREERGLVTDTIQKIETAEVTVSHRQAAGE